MNGSTVIEGRRVLVVGGSSGIGRAFAAEAIRQGAEVCVAARRADELQALCADGGTPLTADVTDPEAVRGMVEDAAAALGGLDLVVYAAGVGTLAPLVDAEAEAWARDYAVNVIGATLVGAAALPHLDAHGLMAFVSSDSTEAPRWGLASYTASKAALDATIRSWRLEHPHRRFTRIVMGPTIPTDFGTRFDDEVLVVAFERWDASAVHSNFMPTEGVGRHLVAVLGTALAHPEIDLPDLALAPRGDALGG
jgi:NAD(P)-dependent dehydrogenase (short-subunit alcohol dehydrogenase family)